MSVKTSDYAKYTYYMVPLVKAGRETPYLSEWLPETGGLVALAGKEAKELFGQWNLTFPH